jgi:CheY-like chemotaxis protein
MSSQSGDILVVDDQPVNVRLLATMLSQLGYKVRKATSGEMALTAIQAEQPDLILLDITMPQMDGYTLCEILKKDPRTAEIPVIFVSALDEAMDKTRAFEVGAADYVAKPFQWAEVQARVKTQLALRQLQHQPSVLNVADIQAALWAESMPTDSGRVTALEEPAIAHFDFAAQLYSAPNATPELLDWQRSCPGVVQLTLARPNARSASSLILLATVRGLFKGFSGEDAVQDRFRRAQILMEPDLHGATESLRLFHGTLNEGDSCALGVRALTYLTQGYTLALVRSQTATIQAPEATIVFEPGDRLFIFSADLQSVNVQLSECLMNCSQCWAGSITSTVMLGQIADELKSAIHYEGSVMMLYCLP